MLERHEELIHRNIIPRLEEVKKEQSNINSKVQEIKFRRSITHQYIKRVT